MAKVRNLLHTKKVGHAGTLDPLAEGVLIILTDQDTKKQQDFMQLEKEYRAEIGFGATSPTYDLEGSLSFNPLSSVTELKQQVENALPFFVGEIEQTVPPYSAKKIDGKRMYKLSRKGKLNLDKLPTKKVTVKNIQVNSLDEKPVSGHNLLVLDCTITCSSGTYIRSIAYDLGEKLGVGGVLLHLVRTRIGDFKIEDARTIESLVE